MNLASSREYYIMLQRLCFSLKKASILSWFLGIVTTVIATTLARVFVERKATVVFVMDRCVEWIEPDMDLQELERELRVIKEDYERNIRIWNPWGVDDPMLDPQEFASVMRDIEAQEEDERTIDPWLVYDSEDEEKGYTFECRKYWDDDLRRYTCACEDFWEDEVCV